MIHSLAFEADTEFEGIDILESTSTDGEIRYTAFMCYDRSLKDLRQRADETVYGSGGWKCSHEHDCCGCWALIDMEVLGFPASEHSFHISRTLETKCLRIRKIVLDEVVKCKYNSISKIEKGK